METVDFLDQMECLEVLGGVPLFAGLAVDELESIAEVTSLRSEPHGEIVFAQGDPGSEMLVVVEGSVEIIHRGSADGPMAVLGPGEVVGELAILRSSERSADVVAGPEGVTGLVIDSTMLGHILQERPQIALAMLAALAEKLAAASTEQPH
ncbi:MAG TPA: cyclic nucleotide-binding domain-containing protein [Acidimicrobiia bacterium]|nr:cyclic nucleotide-binding domain-containing protein [Acidimicrobiia bacterium]